MKKFFTPAINGEFSTAAQTRLEDVSDVSAYETVRSYHGNTDALDRDGYARVFTHSSDGTVTGYITYQQDDL